MYDYRRLSPEQQKQLIDARRIARMPLHEPPHLEWESSTYFLTAAHFEHRPIMADPARRTIFENELLDALLSISNCSVWAWCILPNHYHALVQADLSAIRGKIGRLHNGLSTRWNREDGTIGRQVWYRFNDRGIRSERHHLVAFNYIHANPVKHRYVRRAHQWQWSSLPHYLEEEGRERLQQCWRDYPVLDFGKGWDWW